MDSGEHLFPFGIVKPANLVPQNLKVTIFLWNLLIAVALRQRKTIASSGNWRNTIYISKSQLCYFHYFVGRRLTPWDRTISFLPSRFLPRFIEDYHTVELCVTYDCSYWCRNHGTVLSQKNSLNCPVDTAVVDKCSGSLPASNSLNYTPFIEHQHHKVAGLLRKSNSVGPYSTQPWITFVTKQSWTDTHRPNKQFTFQFAGYECRFNKHSN